jgi:hypothetical protein
VIKINGYEITSVEHDWCVILDDSEGVEIALPCIDEEDAYAMRHMFGGEVVTREIYIGVYHAVADSRSPETTG